MSKKQKIVVFSGAGISAESGIKTFRDSGGLWEDYKIEDVATPQAWIKDKELVLKFYNERRIQVINAKPNSAHKLVANLQNQFDVHVITQNIDDLHERAGSKNVLHLHGQIMKSQSTNDANLVYDVKNKLITIDDKCELGYQLRPHIVWFGEMVPEMDNAIEIATTADVFITIGTSLNVYPAANLINHVPVSSKKYLIDPSDFNLDYIKNLTVLKTTAVDGMAILYKQLNTIS